MTITNQQKINDFRQGYNRTYLQRNSTGFEVVFVHSVADDGMVNYHSIRGTSHLLDPHNDDGIVNYSDHFLFDAPKAGIYAADGDVVFLKRTAKRQWVKGLGENNYILRSVSRQSNGQLSGKIANELFSEAAKDNKNLAVILDGDWGVSNPAKLSDQFSCCPSFNEELWFFFYDLPIAKIKQRDVCTLFCARYHQELSDLFRKHELNRIRIDHV